MKYNNNKKTIRELAEICHSQNNLLHDSMIKNIEKEFKKAQSIDIIDLLRAGAQRGCVGVIWWRTRYDTFPKIIKNKVQEYIKQYDIDVKVKIEYYNVVVYLPTQFNHNTKFRGKRCWFASPYKHWDNINNYIIVPEK